MKITDFKNKYSEERVFLIGNGPSLNKTDLDLITSEYSFGMNGINFIYSQTTWRPTFYLFCQSSFSQTRLSSVRHSVDSSNYSFIYDKHESQFRNRDNVHTLKMRDLKTDPVNVEDSFHKLSVEDVTKSSVQSTHKYWSNNIAEVVYKYHSMYVALQIAMYMGFDEIYFLGCDLGFEKHNPHMFYPEALDPLDYRDTENIQSFLKDAYKNNVLAKSMLNKLIYEAMTFSIKDRRPYNIVSKYFLSKWNQLADPNHFSDNYLPVPKDKRYVNQETAKSHAVARKIGTDRGIKMYNATVGGDLEIYQRVQLEEIV